jgi:hypothetical protein
MHQLGHSWLCLSRCLWYDILKLQSKVGPCGHVKCMTIQQLHLKQQIVIILGCASYIFWSLHDLHTALQAGRSRVRFPICVIRFFHWHNTSGRTMTLGSTQPLTEMSTRDVSWGKGGRCVGLTTLPHTCADCLEIWELEPSGILRVCPGL